MSEEKRGWYVLRAISGKENKVKEVLDAEIKNTDLGKYVFYSGYVFVEAILVGEVVHHLRNTTNVIDFLGGKSNQPEPLRPSEVNRMLGAVDEMQEVGDEPAVVYHVGETVKVNYGPFNGFSGIIEEVNNEKKKLKVMVKIFGRKTPLELENSQVERE